MRNRPSRFLLDFVAGLDPFLGHSQLLRGAFLHGDYAGSMFKHIIVPVDGSDCSLHAADLAASLAKELGAQCTLCTAVDIVTTAGMAAAAPELVSAWLRTLEEQAQLTLKEAAERLHKAGVEADTEVANGYPPDAIVEVAKNRGGDLIVMGSHGRSGLNRLFLGSVAESVLRTAPIPVLIVRSEELKHKKTA